jgi:RNA polymerase sigma factor (sigma-70 family)
MIQEDFVDIYQQNKGLVYRLALSYVRDVQEAEDITQEVFVKVFEKAHQFKGNAQVKTWIYRITTTTSLDFIKAKKRKKRSGNIRSLTDEAGLSIDIQDMSPHPGALVENKELSKYLFAAMDELADPQRSAFYLSQVEGLGNIEIAQMLEKSVGATESLIQRAKANLVTILGSFYDDYRRNEMS